MTWDEFEEKVKEALVNRLKPSDKEPEGPDVEFVQIAKEITNAYHNVVISSKETVVGVNRGFSTLGKTALTALKPGIQAAIFSSLKLMQASNIKPNTAILFPIGAAVISYWSGALVPLSISPLPMPVAPPYITPTPGSLLLFPGVPIPVVDGFKKAYSSNFNDSGDLTSEDAFALMAKDIRDGFEAHMNSVTGIYVGLIPAAPIPIPMVTPWSGMRP